MSSGKKLLLSCAVVLAAILVNTVLMPATTVLTGEAAGQQFLNSDTAYVASSWKMAILPRLGLTLPVVLLVLAVLWRRQIVALFALAVLAALPAPAQAYYDKNDYTEAMTIYPNETAFWIPDNGGNRDSQGRMDSAAYYEANRVALKRFVIPHVKFQGSGFFADYYVPAGRLILVDRAPYNREWVKATTRGTSPRDESFPCQDRDGHDVTVEITIGASVFEQDAAKFLYRFGVKPPVGERGKPEVIFTSVYYSRSLTEVMDTVGRGAVQGMVCSQISIRDLDHVNAEAAQMLASIRDQASATFAAYGITLDFIGWAGTFTFADAVQDAINRRFIAEKDQQIAAVLAPYAGTIQQLATAEALRSFARRSDGKLPTTIVGLPNSLEGLLSVLFQGVPVLSQPPGAPSTPPPPGKSPG